MQILYENLVESARTGIWVIRLWNADTERNTFLTEWKLVDSQTIRNPRVWDDKSKLDQYVIDYIVKQGYAGTEFWYEATHAEHGRNTHLSSDELWKENFNFIFVGALRKNNSSVFEVIWPDPNDTFLRGN